jgi:hypothetical protein
MSDVTPKAISTATIYRALRQLFDDYLVEKADSQRDDDQHDIDYWDSACQTIYDIAAALNIPFEEQPRKPRLRKLPPYQPDSVTPDTADVQPSEGHYPKLRLLCKDSQEKN